MLSSRDTLAPSTQSPGERLISRKSIKKLVINQEHLLQARWLAEHILTRHSEQGSDLGVRGPAGGGEAGEGGGRPREVAGEAGGDGRAGQGLGRAGGFVGLSIFVFINTEIIFIFS